VQIFTAQPHRRHGSLPLGSKLRQFSPFLHPPFSPTSPSLFAKEEGLDVCEVTVTFAAICCFCLQDGQRGHLEGLASVYCELLMAPFGDILSALENARQAAWAERSPLHPAGGSSGGASGSGGSGLSGSANGGIGSASVSGMQQRQQHGHRGHSMHGAGLPNSHSQPIYVPGKYSVCMTPPTTTTTTEKQHPKTKTTQPGFPLKQNNKQNQENKT